EVTWERRPTLCEARGSQEPFTACHSRTRRSRFPSPQRVWPAVLAGAADVGAAAIFQKGALLLGANPVRESDADRLRRINAQPHEHLRGEARATTAAMASPHAR